MKVVNLKNLLQLILKIMNCKIIIKDSNYFHHFENGPCSHHDYC